MVLFQCWAGLADDAVFFYWGSVKTDTDDNGKRLVGKSVPNSTEFHNSPNYRPFELQNFHRNFIFLIVKCVPVNSEHISSSLESSPAIDSSDFMNQKTFLPSVFFGPPKRHLVVYLS
jgi:hypothetical protein